MSIRTSRAIAGIMVVVIVAIVFWYMKKDTDYAAVASFEECVAAGYPIMETFPEQCRTPDGRTFTRATSTETLAASSSHPDNENRIRVNSVSSNQRIESPLTITGQARGSWYFEASFPIEILDGNGKRIAIVPAQATSDWMTAEFVPFSATLTFAKPDTATGTIIFRNDNPSGLPENDRWISVPVRF